MIIHDGCGSVIAQLDWAIQEKELDYPVKPDHDNHWNRVRYEFKRAKQLICTRHLNLGFVWNSVLSI